MNPGRWRGLSSNEGERVSLTWPLVKRVLRYGKPYRKKLLGLLVTILLTTVIGLARPLIFRDLIDNALPNEDLGRLNVLAVSLLVIALVGGVNQVFQRKWNAGVGEGVIYDLRVDLYRHLQRMSIRFYTNTKTGELMSRLNNDVVEAQRAISQTTVEILSNLLQTIAILAVMFTLEWRLTALGILIVPLFVPLSRKSSLMLRKVIRDGMSFNAAMNAMMNETLNIGGVLLVKLFGRKETETDRFRARAADVRDVGVRRAVVMTQFYVLMSLLAAVGTALVYWLGGYFVLKGVFTIGTIVAFSAYLTQLYGLLHSLSSAPVEIATSLVSFERVFEVLDLPLDIQEKADAHVLADVQGEVEFDDVSFAYTASEASLLSSVKRYGQDSIEAVLSGSPNGKSKKPAANGTAKTAANEEGTGYSQAREMALDDVSFHIQPGQLVALVGPSGAGKTTLTYLIPRLYDPDRGSIRIDGWDLRDVTLDSLAAQIGTVTQETHLFHDTIRTNLVYAKLDAAQDEIEAACRAANIHDFIVGLPNGYDTVVGERGYRLSGGEKQRIAIARVILKDPRILVLDEATSHLDSQSEALIQDALKTVMAGRTSIVIAHRLSTILAADKILVMDRGRIVEQGTHEELLALGGLYDQLYETQFSRELMHHEQAIDEPVEG
ncbi:MAG TPA: ABC transporter ATP-binding protein [Aggregatilinea sp.]|uniref:ABC transporter ATP-binding protein n=1 Tax=Aggregatilinea sp. TaxID=2806333 RepID=UPI002C1A9144|nr:ABC transporter ATP-binding protein [Aggregatilinea sp.]HML21065.1 ABC transporter ATP-binding protein [Aggregatilinea sp.]